MKMGQRDLSKRSVLVLGAGSIGRRHLANLRRLCVGRLSTCDPDEGRRQHIAAEFQVETYSEFGQAIAESKPDAVFVCTPPVYHVEQATLAVRAGAHVFIEKPLSDRLQGIDTLKDEVCKNRRVVQVGYNLRFHPGIRKLKQRVQEGAVGKILWARVEVGQYLPDWRPWQDYRQSYTARRDQGGGILLDASHEIDYPLWLLGTPTELVCMGGKVSDLDVDVEDSATILVRFESGCQADIHVDFIQRTYSRSCALVGENGKLLWDYTKNEVSVVCPQSTEKMTYDFDSNQMYMSETEHFFDCIENESAPLCGLDDAQRTLRVALAAKVSANEKKWVGLVS